VHLAAEANGTIHVFNRRTGATRVVCEPECENPSFSPDGRSLVYMRVIFPRGIRRETSIDLEVFDLLSGHTQQITHNHESGFPVWGPKAIAYSVSIHTANGWHSDIWLIDGSGTHSHQLTHMSARASSLVPVSWSASGKQLLAENPPINNGRIWAIDVASGRAHAVTNWVGALRADGLSRDGRVILASIGCGGAPGMYGIVETIPFVGGTPRVIVKGPCEASWNR
jgi:hypothetical protein